MLQSGLEKNTDNKMPRRKGNTNARAQAIIDDCVKKVAKENISHGDWCRYAVKEYSITTRRAEQIWSTAWESIRDRFAKDAETNLLQALARLDDLYNELSEQGYDYNTRANVLKERHKLLGLGVERHEHKVDSKLSFDFAPDEPKDDE